MERTTIEAMTMIMVEARRAQQDIGEIISAALQNAAQELGGIEALVQGRPGSWEADIIRTLGQAAYWLPLDTQSYVRRLAELFVIMGQAKADGGDVLSQAMSAAVDQLGGLKEFAGESYWREYLMNLGRQYSSHWNDGLGI